MRKALPVVVLAMLIAVPALAQTSPAETVPFDHWAYDAVQQVCEAGVIIGYPDGTFKGERAMTRYEFAMAISRLLDKMKEIEAQEGVAGEQGPQGEPGEKGEKGDKGEPGEQGPPGEVDYAKVTEIVNKLLEEFKDELADLKGDVEGIQTDLYDLGDRLTWVEEQLGGPEVTGWLDFRMGLVGDDLDLDHEMDALTAKVGVAGDITDDLYGNLTVKARDSYAPNDGYYSNDLWLDEAYVRFATGSMQWTVGRQNLAYGCGLVVDSDRQSLQGVRGEWPGFLGTGLDIEWFAGNADEVQEAYDFARTPDADALPHELPPNFVAEDADGYLALRASYGAPSWQLGGNYLVSGVSRQNVITYPGGIAYPNLINDETAYSVDFWAEIWDREIFFEAARIKEHANRPVAPHISDPMAYMGSVELWESDNFKLTGFYSDVDAEYDIYYSSINPYYEVLDWRAPAGAYIPWERWLRRPPVLTNFEVMGGTLQFNLAGLPFEVCYYSLDTNGVGYWSPFDPTSNSHQVTTLGYDTLYGVKVVKEVADGVDVGLTWAHQAAADSSSYDDQDLVQAGVTVGF